MLNRLLQQLEIKVEDVIETIQILMLENEELKIKLNEVEQDNLNLRSKEVQWEQSISQLLNKFGQHANAEQFVPQARPAVRSVEEEVCV